MSWRPSSSSTRIVQEVERVVAVHSQQESWVNLTVGVR
jgi:hypothetical protein